MSHSLASVGRGGHLAAIILDGSAASTLAAAVASFASWPACASSGSLGWLAQAE